MNNPLVTVAIITYNSEKFIRETLDSVTQQTYNNWCIVVGDDGSKDNTREILNEYKEKLGDKLILVLHEKNQGANANWNSIVPEFKGKYVAKLDGDDLWLSTKLEKQVKFMELNTEKILSYHYTYIRNDLSKKLLKKRQHKIEGFGTEVLMKNLCFICSCTPMWRNEKEVMVPSDLRKVGDYYLWLKITEGGKIGCIPEYLSEYRVHGNNVTIADNKIEYIDETRKIIEKFQNTVNKEIYEEAIRGIELEKAMKLFKIKNFEGANKILSKYSIFDIKGFKRKLIKTFLKLFK